MPPRIIPKVEFSFGGGAGIGGYLASFPTDPWLMHVGQSDDMKQDYMKFYPPKASLMPAGHAGRAAARPEATRKSSGSAATCPASWKSTGCLPCRFP